MTLLDYLSLYLGAASLGSILVFGAGTPPLWRASVIAFSALCLFLGGAS